MVLVFEQHNSEKEKKRSEKWHYAGHSCNNKDI
jgi:hypothetical protein